MEVIYIDEVKNMKIKKRSIVITVLALLIVGCIAIIIYGKTEFSRLRAERESVAGFIKTAELSVESNGCVTLPDSLKKLSASGDCFVVEFYDQTAIYFYTYRGILESSKGYLYVTDELSYTDYIDTSEYVAYRDFVNIKELGDNWYSCSTD